jgi:hypothetical protein
MKPGNYLVILRAGSKLNDNHSLPALLLFILPNCSSSYHRSFISLFHFFFLLKRENGHLCLKCTDYISDYPK